MSTAQPLPAVRPVLGVLEGMETSDGAGVRMTRLIGTPRLRMLDPFLMLDFFGSDDPGSYIAGFPEHPHRGFETVTYMLAGRMRHADNHGHEGVIETGGVQWMTAGRGILHSEMPEQTEGLMKGFQLWINLPAAKKMTEPGYQEFNAAKIPVERRDGGAAVAVIAGATAQGTAGPVRAEATDARYFDVTLAPGGRFAEPLPADHTAVLVVYEGGLAAPEAGAVRVVVLGEGERVEAAAGPQGARFLLIAGRPLNEPVAWGGPFVMNTREEVMQAFRDFEEGRF
ncbi:pirin family protein [Azospirillum sp. TSO22-1]|uniref:pirin family protein n=1 Tax=Azospirillum sp. TSO22-1 TaxID=716789 RepID=UPI000D60E6A9|nr:pirin family protein [Azospirillum sp. TSO22-1]PWC36767.1 quercetin 2,3-dioxygenase [Azospirillum sp. TSO22-1]